MRPVIEARPLTAEAFAPFGDVLEARGAPDALINQGICARYHDRAALEFIDGRAGISLFKTEPQSLPMKLELLECHPLGSQAFLPMSDAPFLVIVAPDEGGVPAHPEAFVTDGAQGVNYHRGTWHAPLCAIGAPGLFAVVDMVGQSKNLKEFALKQPVTVNAVLA